MSPPSHYEPAAMEAAPDKKTKNTAFAAAAAVVEDCSPIAHHSHAQQPVMNNYHGDGGAGGYWHGESMQHHMYLTEITIVG